MTPEKAHIKDVNTAAKQATKEQADAWKAAKKEEAESAKAYAKMYLESAKAAAKELTDAEKQEAKQRSENQRIEDRLILADYKGRVRRPDQRGERAGCRRAEGGEGVRRRPGEGRQAIGRSAS